MNGKQTLFFPFLADNDKGKQGVKSVNELKFSRQRESLFSKEEKMQIMSRSACDKSVSLEVF